MKKMIVNVTLILAALTLAACQKEAPEEALQGEISAPALAGDEGTVVTTMDAGSYTYVELEKDGNRFWVAGPASDVKVGDYVTVPGGSMMYNFESTTLDRTFESILFAGALNVAGGGQDSGGQKASAGAPQAAAEVAAEVAAGSIAKADGGYTVEEIFKQKAKLGGKSVAVRGKIVKASGFIMGSNWYHIQDGTGEGGANDLTVTSADQVELGTVVVARGGLAVDKDFGSGYKYDVILEDAKIIAE